MAAPRSMKIFLPELDVDGIGSAILPSRVTGLNKNVQMLAFNDRSDARIARLSQILNRANVGIVAAQQYEGGYAVFIQPGAFLGREQWAALGIREHRLTNAGRIKDLAEPAGLIDLYRSTIGQLGIADEQQLHPRLIGSNRYGDQVYHGVLGRTLAKGDAFHAEWQAGRDGRRKGDIDPAAFFRVNSPGSFQNCALNISWMMARGEKLNTARINQLHADMLAGAPELVDTVGYRLLDLQEELETQASSLVEYVGRRNMVSPRSFADRLNSNLAEHKERDGVRLSLQQFSTPFPVARVAFEVTLAQAGQRVLEPTIGNGALISAFVGRPLDIVGVELDPERAERVQRLIPSATILQGDFMSVARNSATEETASNFRNQAGPQFDVVIANPPFENLDVNTVRRDAFGRTVTLRRLDHEIAFEALQQLKADGRGFLVLPGDMIKDGALSGARRFFDNYLRSTYEIAGSCCLDGRLYRKMGANFPVLLYAIGPRRDRPLTDAEIREIEPERLTTVMSFDELYDWCDVTREQMLGLTGLPALELGYAGAATPAPAQAARQAEQQEKPRVSKSRNTASQTSQASPSVDAAAPQAEPDPQVDGFDTAATTTTPQDGDNPISATSVLIDDLEDDTFVRTYEPFSEVGAPKTQIQKSLQGLIYRALLDVQSKHGPIDEYVAGKLQLSVTEMGERFSPEQVDALALNFARHGEGRGFLCGDLMGVGKGRFLAGTALAAFAEDRPVIFFTEAPNLFSDFISRDLAKVVGREAEVMKDSGYIRPFIFNQSPDAPVRREDGKTVLFPVGDVKDAKANGISIDRNLVCATYSQFQTHHGHWKKSAIKDWASNFAAGGRPPHLILDECHKAAGESSATGEMVSSLVDSIISMGGTVTYSSATGIKSGKNIALYNPILPDTGMTVQELIALIEENPLALQEVLASEMARSGSMISREVDMRGVKRTFVPLQTIDPDRYASIVQAVDRVSSFLRELVEFAPMVDEAAARLGSAYAGGGGGDAENKVSVQTTSPVSQFHSFSQYLMVGVKNVFARDMLIDGIADGRKPAFVYENTGKAVLERLVNRIGRDVMIDGIHHRVIDRLPNMGDVLIENASKLLDVKITDSIGTEHDIRIDAFDSWLQDFIERVEAADLSLLSLDPIDQLAEHCAELGLSMGELTRRSLYAQKLPDGTYAVRNRDIGQKQVIVRDFNYGDLDILVLNRSAASGISAHASPANGPDVRPRRMYKMQLQSEITAERQIDGRIHRYGQLYDGEYVIPMSGFAADDRLCQLFNKKNRSLTATTNATRENRTNIGEAADLMNPVGEGVVRQYLGENPRICHILGLPNPKEDAGTESSGYARKLMGRLVLLPIALQEEVLSEIDTQFRMAIDALDAKGLNPLRLTQFDWRAQVETVSVLRAGDENSDKVGKRPLTLVKLTYKESKQPIRFEELAEHVERGRDALVDIEMGRYVSPSEWIGEIIRPNGRPDWSSEIFDKAFSRRPEDISVGMKPIGNDEADAIWSRRDTIDRSKATVAEKRVLRAGDYALFLAQHIGHLEPGRVLNMSTAHWPSLQNTRLATQMAPTLSGSLESIPGVVTSVLFDRRDPLNIAGWKINVAFPGEQWTEQYSMSTAYAVQAEVASSANSVGKVFKSHNQMLLTEPGELFSPYLYDDAHREHMMELVREVGEAKLADLSMSLVDSASELSIHEPDTIMTKVMKLAFNDAPAGEIKLNKYALEGNMFMAVKLTQQKGERLGQKAIYTTSTGEIRHGVILKNDKVERIRLQLMEHIEALSTPLAHQKRPELTEAFLAWFGGIKSAASDYSYSSTGRVQEGPVRDALIVKLSLLLSGGLRSPEIDEYAALRFDDIFHASLLALATKNSSVIYVGSDVFGEYGSKASRTEAIEVDCYSQDRKLVRLSWRASSRDIATVASNQSDKDLQIFVDSPNFNILFHKKNTLVDSALKRCGYDDAMRVATNKIAGQRITKGVLCLEMFHNWGSVKDGRRYSGSDMIAAVLHEQAKATDMPIMLKGAPANLQAVIELHASKAAEYALERRLSAGAQKEGGGLNAA